MCVCRWPWRWARSAPAVTPLGKAAASDDGAVRFYAIWSLAFIGPPAKIATPVVVKALSDKAADVRRKAAYALGRIDADPETVAPALVNALGDADDDVRQTGCDRAAEDEQNRHAPFARGLEKRQERLAAHGDQDSGRDRLRSGAGDPGIEDTAPGQRRRVGSGG